MNSNYINLKCSICDEHIISASEISFVRCGHLFHENCLLQWTRRSKTCPQCRGRCTKRDVFKTYLNLGKNFDIIQFEKSPEQPLDKAPTQSSSEENSLERFHEIFNEIKWPLLMITQIQSIQNQIAEMKDHIGKTEFSSMQEQMNNTFSEELNSNQDSQIHIELQENFVRKFSLLDTIYASICFMLSILFISIFIL